MVEWGILRFLELISLISSAVSSCLLLTMCQGVLLFLMQILRVWFDLDCWRQISLTCIALQAADSKAFQNCSWYDLGKSTDCLSKPGFNAVWGELIKLRADFDQGLIWVDVVNDMAPLSVPLQPDVGHSLFGNTSEANLHFVLVEPCDGRVSGL